MNLVSRMQWQDDVLTIKAPAKLNLFLHITGRRDGGYHELESLFAFTHDGDMITLAPSQQISLTIMGEFSVSLTGLDVTDNLIYQAALMLTNQYHVPVGAAITLQKNLPVAAGIGGGSADAAAALIGLIEFWGLDVSELELDAMALKLGADVPACLRVCPQWVTGIGERRENVSIEYGEHILLVNPAVSISTASIFNAYKDNGCVFDCTLPSKDIILNDYNMLKAIVDNSLQACAMEIAPAVGETLEAIAKQLGCQLSRMSGSGATCFGMFDSEDSLNEAAKNIQKMHPDWWVYTDSLVMT